MKVLRKVCRHCGYLMLFSVEVVCRPGTAVDLGPHCPACGEPQSPTVLATELDIEEIDGGVDEETIRRAISRYV